MPNLRKLLASIPHIQRHAVFVWQTKTAGHNDLLLVLDVVAIQACLHHVTAFGACNVLDSALCFRPQSFELGLQLLHLALVFVCFFGTKPDFVSVPGSSGHSGHAGSALRGLVMRLPDVQLDTVNSVVHSPKLLKPRLDGVVVHAAVWLWRVGEIGRASCRERV